MDEHDATPPQDQTPTSHPLPPWAPPAPPPAPPVVPPTYAAPPAPPPAPQPRRSTPRLLAAGTAVALVVAAGGAGFALGHHRGGADPAATPPNGYVGQAPQQGEGDGTSPFDGTQPFTGPDQDGGGSFDSSSSGTSATDDQLNGLVRIATTLKYEGGKAAGTGMILTSTGEVVTNHHVVEGSTKIRVTVMSTGQHYRATVVGTDAQDDVAVLQLTNATGLSVVETATTPAAVGDAVTAVGDAGGSATTFTAAEGTVTALDQHITTQSQGSSEGEKLRGLMEISSDVISGDSGGATYDEGGEVVGMTTAASTGQSDVVGYAVPIAKVLSIADDLESGTVNARYEYGNPAFLGIGLAPSGITVAGVYPGTPAARAGIVRGDRITRIGDTSVSSAAALRQAVRAYAPGDSVRVVWSDAAGTTHMATVTLIAGPVA